MAVTHVMHASRWRTRCTHIKKGPVERLRGGSEEEKMREVQAEIFISSSFFFLIYIFFRNG